MDSRARERFDAEIATLRDQLVEAVRLHRLSAIEEGLSVLQEVARLIVNRSATVDEIMGERRRDLPMRDRFRRSRTDRLGPLGEALWPVIEQTISHADATIFYEVSSSVRALARVARERSDAASFDDVLSLYPRAAERIHAEHEDRFLQGSMEVIDSQVNAIVGVLAMSRRTQPDAALHRQLLEVAIKQSMHVAKVYIENQNDEGLTKWAVHYRRALPDPDTYEPMSAEAHHAAIVGQVGYLALQSWVLLMWKEPWGDLGEEAARAMHRALRGQRPPGNAWDAAVASERLHFNDRLGFHWWEAAARPETGRAYMVVSDHYVDDALLLDLIDRSRSTRQLPRPRELATMKLEELEAHGQAANRLRRSLDRIDSYRELLGDDLINTGRERLDKELAAIAEVLDERRTERLIRLPLEEDRIAAFSRAALTVAMDTGGSLSALLPRCEEHQGAEVTEDPKTSAFGVHTLVPKDYFTETHVHARPESIGADFGRAVLRGETDHIAERLREACATKLVATEETVDAEIRSQLKQANGHSHVIVFGSLEAWRAISPPGSYGDSFEHAGVEHRFFPGSSLNGVLVADLQRFGCYDRLPTTDGSAGEPSPVLTAVQLIDKGSAMDMAHGRLEDADAEEVNAEALRLQAFARVKVLITPWVRVRDADYGSWIQVLEPS